MKCPNCERLVSTFALRCRVCHQRLPLWYALIGLLLLVGFGGLMILLEIY